MADPDAVPMYRLDRPELTGSEWCPVERIPNHVQCIRVGHLAKEVLHVHEHVEAPILEEPLLVDAQVQLTEGSIATGIEAA